MVCDINFKKTMKILLTIVFGAFFLTAMAQRTAPVRVLVLNNAGKPYQGDKIYFVGQTNKDSHSGVSDAQGKFTVNLPVGQVYDIRIKSIGEEIEYNELEIPDLKEGEVLEDAILTISYEAPKSYTLSSIQFETSKADLKKESYTVLADLVEIMTLKPAMKIQIGGHTDSDGDDAANLLLSQKRADAVKNYLISKGIAASRLVAIG